MKKRCIVVTGLPGSGKSTIGRKVANFLNFDFLDKDDYLENLFREKGVGDVDWRRKLSRESDKQFQCDAVALKSVVLVSHWRPIGQNDESGTSIKWIGEEFPNITELYCSCSVEEATRRFVDRNRHPGHLDRQRSQEEILAWMEKYQQKLPIALGSLVSIDTRSEVQMENIVDSFPTRYYS